MPNATWRRTDGGPELGPRSVIHIDDALPAERVEGSSASPISLTPLTGPDCDLTVLTFELPPDYVGKVHWHPADTVYVGASAASSPSTARERTRSATSGG